MRELTEAEIDDVRGGLGPWGAFWGAVIGAGGYVAGMLATGGRPSVGGALVAGSLGGASGFMGNAAGAISAAGYRGAAHAAQAGSAVLGVGAAAAGPYTTYTGMSRWRDERQQTSAGYSD